jgi:hypothetical protein
MSLCPGACELAYGNGNADLAGIGVSEVQIVLDSSNQFLGVRILHRPPCFQRTLRADSSYRVIFDMRTPLSKAELYKYAQAQLHQDAELHQILG